MASLTIGALAKHAGVGVETVRFYERRGLVRRPARPGSGYRAYPEETVGRLRFIRNAQALGFTLQEIKEMLALRRERAARRLIKSTSARLARERSHNKNVVSRRL